MDAERKAFVPMEPHIGAVTASEEAHHAPDYDNIRVPKQPPTAQTAKKTSERMPGAWTPTSDPATPMVDPTGKVSSTANASTDFHVNPETSPYIDRDRQGESQVVGLGMVNDRFADQADQAQPSGLENAPSSGQEQDRVGSIGMPPSSAAQTGASNNPAEGVSGTGLVESMADTHLDDTVPAGLTDVDKRDKTIGATMLASAGGGLAAHSQESGAMRNEPPSSAADIGDVGLTTGDSLTTPSQTTNNTMNAQPKEQGGSSKGEAALAGRSAVAGGAYLAHLGDDVNAYHDAQTTAGPTASRGYKSGSTSQDEAPLQSYSTVSTEGPMISQDYPAMLSGIQIGPGHTQTATENAPIRGGEYLAHVGDNMDHYAVLTPIDQSSQGFLSGGSSAGMGVPMADAVPPHHHSSQTTESTLDAQRFNPMNSRADPRHLHSHASEYHTRTLLPQEEGAAIGAAGGIAASVDNSPSTQPPTQSFNGNSVESSNTTQQPTHLAGIGSQQQAIGQTTNTQGAMTSVDNTSQPTQPSNAPPIQQQPPTFAQHDTALRRDGEAALVGGGVSGAAAGALHSHNIKGQHQGSTTDQSQAQQQQVENNVQPRTQASQASQQSQTVTSQSHSHHPHKEHHEHKEGIFSRVFGSHGPQDKDKRSKHSERNTVVYEKQQTSKNIHPPVQADPRAMGGQWAGVAGRDREHPTTTTKITETDPAMLGWTSQPNYKPQSYQDPMSTSQNPQFDMQPSDTNTMNKTTSVGQAKAIDGNNVDEMRQTPSMNAPSAIHNASNTTRKGSERSNSGKFGDKVKILTKEALQFTATLQRAFNGRRKQLLQLRDERQKKLDAGALPDFLPETAHIRNDDTWRGAPPGPKFSDRRVEITGPTSRKMVINAMNSGATTFMADFEDSTAPTWDNMIDGQINLRDAVRGTISLEQNGKKYALRSDGKVAVLIVRPRGWHLPENHMLVDGEPMSGSIFDFALYFYHNAHELVKRGFGPYYYLPKMESHLEARLWNDVFCLAQDMIGMPRGTIRGTVLIETILAAFEMDEIIYELREHSSGLNCGRWDYIFSTIKKLRQHPRFVLPDRSDVTMTVPFMDAYVRLLIKTCHRRGVHAMGGMAAQIPIKNNAEANNAAMEKVRNDKLREVTAGHDGTWVAHPDLVKIALEVFNEHMPQPNQLFVRREDVNVTQYDLLNVNFAGAITEQGIRANIDIGLTYMEAWLRGVGCVPIHNLMEDAATAEISRSQLWQWAKHQPTTKEGKKITPQYLTSILDQELDRLRKELGQDKFAKSKFEQAAKHFRTQCSGKDADYADFLTSLLYDDISTIKRSGSVSGSKL
ncbi:hypothetical protein BZG36_02004 [Bifiguratus adelaidae]|uniref:malate synthase n=1 Tax=Bifiguratus adelaidae TaxID=1938954 RepID=A0A261Y499_9FUNG|nr:hypothetical protein BZG36_02004 [Bifiguratus adelaidae]